jgi:hypothetical protein
MNLLNINAMILALECGAYSKNVAVEWADDLIRASDEPDERLFDVSTSKDVYAAISSLSKFGEYPDRAAVAKKAFQIFSISLENKDVTFESIAEKIYHMAFAGDIPSEEAEGEMISYWDSLDIANDGIYGDPQEIKKELLSFIKTYGS